MRLYFNYSYVYFSAADKADGMEQLYNALSLTDEVVTNCYDAFNDTIDLGTEGITWETVLVNVLNNVGYMYTDVINIVSTDSSTQSNYPYFLAYNIGDFIIRWFWSSEIDHEIPGTPRQWYKD